MKYQFDIVGQVKSPDKCRRWLAITVPGVLGLCAFQQHHWCLGRHWRHPGNAAYSFLFGSHLCSLLLYYPLGSMESQFPQRAFSPTAILGPVTALNLGEQENLAILGE